MAFQLNPNVFFQQKTLSDYMKYNEDRDLKRAAAEQTMEAQKQTMETQRQTLANTNKEMAQKELKYELAVVTPETYQEFRQKAIKNGLPVPEQWDDSVMSNLRSAVGLTPKTDYSIQMTPSGEIFGVDKRTLKAYPVNTSLSDYMPEMQPTQQSAPVAQGSITTQPVGNIDQYAAEQGLMPPTEQNMDSLTQWGAGFEKGGQKVPIVLPSNQQMMPPTLPENIPDKQFSVPRPAPTGMPKVDVGVAEAAGKADINVAQKYAEPLPTQLVKIQDDAISNIATANTIKSDLDTFRQQIKSGQLDLGFVKNILAGTANFVGMSDEQSRAYESFVTRLEELRNDSLAMQKGVQTEGDAQRAWNELIRNINDPQVVDKRLQEIINVNDRFIDLTKKRVNTLRGEYKKPPMDFNELQTKSAIVTEDPRIAKAKALGYTDEEIQQYLGSRK